MCNFIGASKVIISPWFGGIRSCNFFVFCFFSVSLPGGGESDGDGGGGSGGSGSVGE